MKFLEVRSAVSLNESDGRPKLVRVTVALNKRDSHKIIQAYDAAQQRFGDGAITDLGVDKGKRQFDIQQDQAEKIDRFVKNYVRDYGWELPGKPSSDGEYWEYPGAPITKTKKLKNGWEVTFPVSYRYNGGIVIHGRHYKGIKVPPPVVPDGYKLVGIGVGYQLNARPPYATELLIKNESA